MERYKSPRLVWLLVVLLLASYACSSAPALDTSDGWAKIAGNPVLGGALGTCFDVAVLETEGRLRMWFSWRPQRSIALTESADGIHWEPPTIVLEPDASTGWEEEVNRPTVLQRKDGYHMWYTGQTREHSWIGYATSPDGISWTRQSRTPVLSPENTWEKAAVMCPHVLWDAEAGSYRMWYSGGEQYEPDAIGYATSPDGLHWQKQPEPIFSAANGQPWERHKVTAAFVTRHEGWYLMFYIGFRNNQQAQIGLARSHNGVDGWERHPANPLIRPGPARSAWDHDAVYKPSVLLREGDWWLWYNGRRASVEQIGLAVHPGAELFAPPGTPAP